MDIEDVLQYFFKKISSKELKLSKLGILMFSSSAVINEQIGEKHS
jgi:hypothetical protein